MREARPRALGSETLDIPAGLTIADRPAPSRWCGLARTVGYVYDRDSALLARDPLEHLIMELTRGSKRKLVIVGHSMGKLLIMETLRQIEISGSVDAARKSAVS